MKDGVVSKRKERDRQMLVLSLIIHAVIRGGR